MSGLGTEVMLLVEVRIKVRSDSSAGRYSFASDS